MTWTRDLPHSKWAHKTLHRDPEIYHTQSEHAKHYTMTWTRDLPHSKWACKTLHRDLNPRSTTLKVIPQNITPWLEPEIYHTQSQPAKHYTVTWTSNLPTLKVSTQNITPWLEPMIYHTQKEYAKHYTVTWTQDLPHSKWAGKTLHRDLNLRSTTLKVSMQNITPWLEPEIYHTQKEHAKHYTVTWTRDLPHSK